MKKNKITFILCSVLFLFLIINSQINAKAESTKAEFIGEIKPLSDFMFGDYVSNQDFSIEGKLVYMDTEYALSELKIWGGKKIYEDGDEVLIYFQSKVDDRIIYGTSIPVKVVDFNPQLVSNIEGVKYTFDKRTNVINGKRVSYINGLNLEMKNKAGKIIQGKTEFSENWNYTAMGIDEITYTFTPYDERYNVYEGSFTRISKVIPKIKTTKNKIRIELANKNDRYIFRINGKDYKEQNIFNLKSKTDYTIEIIQNNPTYSKQNMKSRMSINTTETDESVTLFTTTVKTK